MSPWVKVDDKLHDNDKLGGVSDPAFRLWVLALSWSNDKLSDGHIPASRPLKLLTLRNEKKTIAELLEAKLWHRASSPCRSCEQQREEKHGDDVPSGGYVIHDYFMYQRAAWIIRAERDKNVRAGRRSGEVRREQSVEQTVEHNGQHSVERSVERSVEQSVEHKSPKTTLSVQHNAEPRTPYPRGTRTKYEVPDEPAIPDEPERSKDRRVTRGLQPLSAGLRRAMR